MRYEPGDGRRKESSPDPVLELRAARKSLERAAKSPKAQSPTMRALIAGLRAEVQWWSRKAGTRIAGVYTARDD